MFRHKGKRPHSWAISNSSGGSCDELSSATPASNSTDSVNITMASSKIRWLHTQRSTEKTVGTALTCDAEQLQDHLIICMRYLPSQCDTSMHTRIAHKQIHMLLTSSPCERIPRIRVVTSIRDPVFSSMHEKGDSCALSHRSAL